MQKTEEIRTFAAYCELIRSMAAADGKARCLSAPSPSPESAIIAEIRSFILEKRNMTAAELRDKLIEMTKEEFVLFKKEMGGEGNSVDYYVGEFLRSSGRLEPIYSHYLKIPSETERSTKAQETLACATVSAAESAKASSEAARASARHAEEANRIASEANEIAKQAIERAKSAEKSSWRSTMLSCISFVAAIASLLATLLKFF